MSVVYAGGNYRNVHGTFVAKRSVLHVRKKKGGRVEVDVALTSRCPTLLLDNSASISTSTFYTFVS